MRLDELPPELLRHIASFCAEVHNGVSLTLCGRKSLAVRVSIPHPLVRQRVAQTICRVFIRDDVRPGRQLRCLTPSSSRPESDHFHGGTRRRWTPRALRQAVEARLAVCNRCDSEDMVSFGVRLPPRALACTCRRARDEWIR